MSVTLDQIIDALLQNQEEIMNQLEGIIDKLVKMEENQLNLFKNQQTLGNLIEGRKKNTNEKRVIH